MSGFKEVPGVCSSCTMSKIQLRHVFEEASRDGYAFLVTTTVAQPIVDGAIVHELPLRIRRGHEEDDLRAMYNRFGCLHFEQVFNLNRPFDEQYTSGLPKSSTHDISSELAEAEETIRREITEVDARARQPKWKRWLGMTPKPDCPSAG